MLKKFGNSLEVEKSAFDGFEKDYIKTMLDVFGEDTKWFTITEKRKEIEGLSLEDDKDKKELNEFYKFVKKGLESNSYKAGYEIAKVKDNENPYEYIQQVKDLKDAKVMKDCTSKIIDYLKKHKEIYCMKDIIYNKINMFWESVSFLNRNANTKDIEEEYKKSFVLPVQSYLEKGKKSEYNCIECGNEVSKSDASSMGWLKDVGVDIARKKSGFWNFVEDTYICPICNLIYSCVPLGFYIYGRESIFINQNNSISLLKDTNNTIKRGMQLEENRLMDVQHFVFNEMAKKFEKQTNKEYADNEMQNIQVIKRKVQDDKVIHELNIISKEKLKIFKNQLNNFEKLMGKFVKVNDEYINVYDKTMENFLEGKNQYDLLDLLIRTQIEVKEPRNYKKAIVNIQIASKGGKEMEQKEIEEYGKKMYDEGKRLQSKYFGKENVNKLRSYIWQLSNALRTNNQLLFADIVTRMYGGLGEKIRSSEAFSKAITNKDLFRTLGYAYVTGLEAYTKEDFERDNNKEENDNEE